MDNEAKEHLLKMVVAGEAQREGANNIVRPLSHFTHAIQISIQELL